jgi:hypothetical protein
MQVGTTAVVALLGRHSLWVANAGDSRAVLCRGGAALPLSQDHKANRDDEVARVQAAGGHVWWNRQAPCSLQALERAVAGGGAAALAWGCQRSWGRRAGARLTLLAGARLVPCWASPG